MKKIMSVVLALVMMMSLTTAAWGATTYTAGTPDELETAVSSAVAGDTIKFTADITVTAETVSVASTFKAGIEVAPGVIIDGNGYTLTVEGIDDVTSADTTAKADSGDSAIFAVDGITVKNLTIVGGVRGIYICSHTYKTGNKAVEVPVVIDNVEILNSCRPINVTSDAVGGTMTVSNSKLAGKLSYDNQLDTVEFINCEFVENGCVKGDVIEPWGSQTSFDNCVFAAGFEVNLDDAIDKDPTATISMTDCVYAGEPLTEDNMDDLVVASTTIPAGYVSTPATTAGVKTNFYEADASLTTKWALVDTFPGATVADFLVEADYDDGNMGGNLEHYVVNGDLYVPATKATGAYKLVCGKTEVYLNAAAPDEIFYVAEAEVFTGVTTDEEACGKVLVAKKNLTKTYYTATIVDDKVEYTYYFVADKAGLPLLVNGKIVKAAIVGNDFDPDDADNNFIFHSWGGNDVDAKTKAYTTLKCENCGRVAKLFANADAAGKGAQYLSGFGWITAADAGYDVVVPTTPSTDKVTSAETFDAGIAMYVGMSVMAAAGSAVVLKKKD